MHIQTSLELTMGLDTDKFQKLFKRAYGKEHSGEDEYIDYTMASQGITTTYRNTQYKKKIRLVVDPAVVLHGDDLDSNIPKFIRKLDIRITDYFKSKYTLDNFDLTKIVLATDIDVHSRGKVSDYLKVLQRIGRVKGFSPSSNNVFGEDVCFWLEGNSSGVEFIAYDLEEMMKEQLKETDDNCKKLKPAIERADGVLRVEVRLIKQKAIRGYTDKTDTAKQIADLCKSTQTIFLDTFVGIIPFGDFCKKDKAVEIIRREVTDDKLRRRMLRLLELIPEKKSVLLAQKALNYRRIDEAMDAFAGIDLSPVTISKRHGVKRLKNLYGYL